MKKKILLFSALVGFLAVTLLVGTSSKGLNLIRTTATDSYTLVFNAEKNDYAEITSYQDGLYATTSIGNKVSLAVSDLADFAAYEDGAFTIAAGGYVENTTGISGITAVTAHTAGGEALKLHLGYDGTTYLETVTLSGEGSAFEFDHTQPNYLRFENDSEAAISITSISVEYTCVEQGTIYEVLGTHNNWTGGITDRLYYNYSYENISYEDQWMIKGLTLENGAEFKIHGNGEWYGTEILSSSSGSAVAAGQLGGSGNIEVLANSITMDIYFKFNRDATENKYSMWIGADPNAEVPEVETETYRVYVVTDWEEVCAHMWIKDGAETAWPGLPCTKYADKENTWYIEVPVDKNYENIIFNNGGNGQQTADLEMPAQDAEENCYYVGVAKWGTLDVEPEADPDKLTTIYFDNSTKKWANVYIYLWGGAGANGWPGTKMTRIGTTNYWSFDLTGNTCVNCIFNNGSGGGSNQTGDLTVPTDGTNCHNGSSWSTYNPAS